MPAKSYTFNFLSFVQYAPYGKEGHIQCKWPSSERENMALCAGHDIAVKGAIKTCAL